MYGSVGSSRRRVNPGKNKIYLLSHKSDKLHLSGDPQNNNQVVNLDIYDKISIDYDSSYVEHSENFMRKKY